METPRTPTRNPSLANHEATIRRKAKFFEAIDSRASDRSIKDICYDKNIEYRTAIIWLRRRRLRGSPTTGRSRKHRTGRKPKISDETLQKLLVPAENPHRWDLLQV